MNSGLDLIIKALRQLGADAGTIDSCRGVFYLEMEFSFKRGLVAGLQQVEDVINQERAAAELEGGR